ncbi:MAG: type IV pilin-like G/H family protein [Coleofasciculaceae cyanobacterium]
MSRTCFNRLGIPTVSVWLTTIIMLSAIGQNIVIAQPSTTPDNSSSPPEVLAPEAKLRGQWQAKNPLSWKVLTFTFAPEGKLLIQLPSTSEKPTAQEFGYRIKATSQPMQLDILFPGTDQVVKTIFEFTPTGEMRLQVAGTNPGDPRPTAFRADATLLQKVSEVTTLPPNVEVQTMQMQLLQAQQREGKIILGSMNRAQQAYYLENKKFATTISELGLGIKPETDSYRYQIISQKDSTGSVMMTATAKRSEFRSYTSAVFVVKDKNQQLPIAGICETDKPSTTPPAMPQAQSNTQATIECPAGSNQVGR